MKVGTNRERRRQSGGGDGQTEGRSVSSEPALVNRFGRDEELISYEVMNILGLPQKILEIFLPRRFKISRICLQKNIQAG